jgi:hypothetical protein
MDGFRDDSELFGSLDDLLMVESLDESLGWFLIRYGIQWCAEAGGGWF